MASIPTICNGLARVALKLHKWALTNSGFGGSDSDSGLVLSVIRCRVYCSSMDHLVRREIVEHDLARRNTANILSHRLAIYSEALVIGFRRRNLILVDYTDTVEVVRDLLICRSGPTKESIVIVVAPVVHLIIRRHLLSTHCADIAAISHLLDILLLFKSALAPF